jgi:hypothetical protein
MSTSGLQASFDMRRFQRGAEFLVRTSKRGGESVLREQARGFVRRAIDITPPSTGKASNAAKKKGEASVEADLRRIMTPKKRSWLEHLEQIAGGNKVEAQVLRRKDGTAYLIDYDFILWGRGSLADFHQKRRRQSDGRVKRTNRGVTTGRKLTDGADMAFVPADNFAWYLKRAKQRVGLLAGGFNAAADELGVSRPSWIKRHGTGRGDIDVSIGASLLAITITNDVPYAGTVRGFQPRLQRALNDQAKAMEKRIDHWLAQQGRRAGFR